MALDFTLPALRAARQYELEGEPDSAIRRLTGGVLSGLSAVGNLLDLPGSAVRDILGGENPLDQFLHPFLGQDRLSGRDLLRRGGVIGPENNWANFLGGLGAEIALDPLLPLTVGGKALTPIGKIVQKAGLMDEVPKIAAKKVGKDVGKRYAKVTTSARDIIENTTDPTVVSRLRTAMANEGLDLNTLMTQPNNILDERIGSVFGYLGKSIGGKGPKSQHYLHALDVVGKSIAGSKLGRAAGYAFNPLFAFRGKSALSRTGQLTHRDTRMLSQKTTEAYEKGMVRTAQAYEDIANQMGKYTGPIVPGHRVIHPGDGSSVLVRSIDNNGVAEVFDPTLAEFDKVPVNQLKRPEGLDAIPHEDFVDFWTNTLAGRMRFPEEIGDRLQKEVIQPIKRMVDIERLRLQKMGFNINVLDEAVIDEIPFKSQAHKDTFKQIMDLMPHKAMQLLEGTKVKVGNTWHTIGGFVKPGEPINRLQYLSRSSWFGRQHPARQRAKQLVGFEGSTETINRLFRNQHISDILDAKKADQNYDAVKALREYISKEETITKTSTTWPPIQAGKIGPVVRKRKIKKRVARDDLGIKINDLQRIIDDDKVAGKIVGFGQELTPEERVFGAYATDPIVDMTHAGLTLGDTANALETTLRQVTRHMEHVAGTREEYVTLSHFFSTMLTPGTKKELKYINKSDITEGVTPYIFRQMSPAQQYDVMRSQLDRLKVANKHQTDMAVIRNAIGKLPHGDPSGGFMGITPADLDGMSANFPQALKDRLTRMNSTGIAHGKLFNDKILSQRIPKSLATDLVRMFDFNANPDDLNPILGAVDSFINMWKGLQLGPWPAYHVRNAYSGQIANAADGTWSRKSVRDTRRFLQTGISEEAKNIPEVQRVLKERGIAVNDKSATRVFQELIAGQRLYGAGKGEAQQGLLTDLAGEVMQGPRAVRIPGSKPFGTTGEFAKETLQTAVGMKRPEGVSFRQAMAPWNQAGVFGREVTTLGAVAAGREVSNYVEGMNRIAPFMKQLLEGVDVAEAARRVKAAQIDYSRAAFTPFENTYLAGRIFPFYRWTARMLPWTVRQLIEQPGGEVAQMIRASTSRHREDDQFVPERVGRTLAIPLGEEREGRQRFLTQFDLAHEGALQPIQLGTTAGLTLRNMGRALTGMMGPHIQYGLKTTFGVDPFTGRDMSDLEGGTNRLLSNIAEQINRLAGTDLPTDRKPLAGFADDALTSLAARFITAGRTVTETRGTPGERLLKGTTNLLTGARISDINMEIARAEEQKERLSDILRPDPLVRYHGGVYVRKEDEEKLSPYMREVWERLKALNKDIQVQIRTKKQAEVNSKLGSPWWDRLKGS